MLANGSDAPFVWSYCSGSDLKSTLAYPNGLTASWQYDAKDQLLQVCNATPTNVISQYDYTYDAAGRRTARDHSGYAFEHADHIDYGYNMRNELTNAIATVDSDYCYVYVFDDIGNRVTSTERSTNILYTANSLNHYTQISNLCDSASPCEDFMPQFDDDGNQTLIKTATGIWSVTYNGENRPVLWTLVNSTTPSAFTPTLISMSYDRLGRRVTKNDKRFVYNGYLQIANFEHQTSNFKLQTLVWDPTEPIATRPLVWNLSTIQPFNYSTSYYTHDGNKNVVEIIAIDGFVTAHYEYAPFGAETAQCVASAADNPCRFSSEYSEKDTAMVYYNYRHYVPEIGRWLCFDPIAAISFDVHYNYFGLLGNDQLCINALSFLKNNPCGSIDIKGLFDYFCVCPFVPYPVGEAGYGEQGGKRCTRERIGELITVQLDEDCVANLPKLECYCSKRKCTLVTTFQCVAMKGSFSPVYFAWKVVRSRKTGCRGK